MQKKVLAAVFCSLVGISGLLVTGCATIVGRSDQTHQLKQPAQLRHRHHHR